MDITNKCSRPFSYELVDFYLVAFLMCEKALIIDTGDEKKLLQVKLGAKIKQVKSHEVKKGTRIFVLDMENDIDNIIRSYYNNDVMVSPKELSQNVRDLKSIIYQFKEKHKPITKEEYHGKH